MKKKRKESRLKQEIIKEKINKLHFADEECYLTLRILAKAYCQCFKNL